MIGKEVRLLSPSGTRVLLLRLNGRLGDQLVKVFRTPECRMGAGVGTLCVGKLYFDAFIVLYDYDMTIAAFAVIW